MIHRLTAKRAVQAGLRAVESYNQMQLNRQGIHRRYQFVIQSVCLENSRIE